jgi:Flp pilus assembly protein protease CpaA
VKTHKAPPVSGGALFFESASANATNPTGLTIVITISTVAASRSASSSTTEHTTNHEAIECSGHTLAGGSTPEEYQTKNLLLVLISLSLAGVVYGFITFPVALLISVLSIAVITDLNSRRIPNWLTYSALLAGLVSSAIVSLQQHWHLSTPFGIPNLPTALMGFSATFGVMLTIYVLLGIGAGDVKLAGVIGATLGAGPGLQILLWTHILAGIFSLLLVVQASMVRSRAATLKAVHKTQPSESHCSAPSVDHQYPVPMAVFFALATALIFTEGSLL